MMNRALLVLLFVEGASGCSAPPPNAYVVSSVLCTWACNTGYYLEPLQMLTCLTCPVAPQCALSGPNAYVAACEPAGGLPIPANAVAMNWGFCWWQCNTGYYSPNAVSCSPCAAPNPPCLAGEYQFPCNPWGFGTDQPRGCVNACQPNNAYVVSSVLCTWACNTGYYLEPVQKLTCQQCPAAPNCASGPAAYVPACAPAGGYPIPANAVAMSLGSCWWQCNTGYYTADAVSCSPCAAPNPACLAGQYQLPCDPWGAGYDQPKGCSYVCKPGNETYTSVVWLSPSPTYPYPACVWGCPPGKYKDAATQTCRCCIVNYLIPNQTLMDANCAAYTSSTCRVGQYPSSPCLSGVPAYSAPPACVACAALTHGNFTSQGLANQPTSCNVTCNVGYYQSSAGACGACATITNGYLPAAGSCAFTCNVGFFQTAGKCQAWMSACNVSGYQWAAGNATVDASCSQCSPGKYRTNLTILTCQPCTAVANANFTVAGACNFSCIYGFMVKGTGCQSWTAMGLCTSMGFGWYPGTPTSDAFCMACPQGTFRNATAVSTCTQCPAGTYTANTQTQNCLAVPANGVPLSDATGFTCNMGYQVLANPLTPTQPSCSFCPDGMDTVAWPDYTQTNSYCSQCPPGSYRTAPYIMCVACTLGTYQPNYGGTVCPICPGGSISDWIDAVSCKACSPGTYKPDGVRATSCTVCGIGTYQQIAGRSTCTACPFGSFANTGTLSCTPCPAGTFNPDGNPVSACTLCSVGTYANAGYEQCTDCSVGFYTGVNVGAISCTACSPGTYHATGDSPLAWKGCPAGTYAPSYGYSACLTWMQNCPQLGYGWIAGSGTQDATCSVCPPPTPSSICIYPPNSCAYTCIAGYQPTAGVGCTLCMAGSFNAAGSTVPCSPCAAGTYQPVGGMSACSACQAGSFASTWGLTSCTLCRSGLFTAASATVCLGCPAGTYSTMRGAAACVSCGQGMVSGRGATYCYPAGSATAFYNGQVQPRCQTFGDANLATCFV